MVTMNLWETVPGICGEILTLTGNVNKCAVEFTQNSETTLIRDYPTFCVNLKSCSKMMI